MLVIGIATLIIIDLFLRSTAETSTVQPFSKEQMMRPDLMSDFSSMRNLCEWKQSTLDVSRTSCPGAMQECVVNVTLPEGSGFLHVSRLGPYTTRGDFQQILCVGRGFIPPEGSWLTRSVVGPVDPHTGESIEFPPLHIHHLVTKTLDNPSIPDEYAKYMPFLNFLQTRSSTPSFPSGVSDAQCTEKHGGINCLHLKIPDGYGQRSYGQGEDSYLYVHMQDVRRAGSPPLSHYIDYASIFIMKPAGRSGTDQQAAMKATMHGALEVIGTGAPPYTYQLEENKAMYNMVTYYMPTAVQFVGNRMHWHSMEGDEAWIVRGTQADLGVPQVLQRPPAVLSGAAPNGLPMEIPAGDSAAFKSLLEQHLNKVISEYPPPSSANFAATAAVEQSNFTRMDQLPLNYLPSRPPQILCKYYGKQELITVDTLREKENHLKEVYRQRVISRPEGAVSALNNLLDNFIPKKYKSFEYAGISEELSSITVRLTTRDEQFKATYTGALPGMYYRAAETSAQRAVAAVEQSQQQHENGGAEYMQCDAFDVRPGEQLTLIHFNVPRPSDGGQSLQPQQHEQTFNTSELVQNQHTIFMSNVHLPALNLL